MQRSGNYKPILARNTFSRPWLAIIRPKRKRFLLDRAWNYTIVNPNVADVDRGKTRQGAPDVAAHRLGQAEAYFTVHEILAEATTGADGAFWREHRGFGAPGL